MITDSKTLFVRSLFPIIAVAIWATNAVVSKMATATIEPGTIAFYRWFVALLVLTPFCLIEVSRQWPAVKKCLLKLTILASLGMVLNQSLAYYAAYTTSATNIAIFLSLMPLIGLFLAVPLLGAKLHKMTLLGAVISFCGLIYMLSEGNPIHIVSQGLKQGDSVDACGILCLCLVFRLAKPLEVTFNHLVCGLLPSVSWRASATAFIVFKPTLGNRNKGLAYGRVCRAGRFHHRPLVLVKRRRINWR